MSTNIAKPVRRLLDRAQKRFVRSRSGSVLILVVALLVLMALIGTAFMTMAQFDRASAVQHSFNTEVDLLLDGVINQVKGTITSDVYSSGMFRPSVIIASSTNQPVPYNTPQLPSAPRYWNGLGLDNGAAAALLTVTPGISVQAGDWWLASRVPGLPAETAIADQVINPPWWPFISGPITGASNFDQPYWPNGVAPTPLTARTQLVPTSVTINGQIWPAFATTSFVGGAVTVNGRWMAADADGDGIADSGLVKLLTLDGVTYYGAVRIVDNAAAVNANIADVPNAASTYTAGSTLPGDLSPVNIDLEGMINPDPGTSTLSDLYGASASNLQGLIDKYRWNGATPGQTPFDDNNAQRQDFQFPTDNIPAAANSNFFNSNGNYYFNEQWLQLGRRLNNPGYMASGVKFQSLPISEDQNLARGFILRNSSVANSTLSSSVLEQRMPYTLFNPAPTAPYVPGDEKDWYNGSFNYYNELTAGNSMSKRPLIVGQNPVSNFSPVRFNLTPPTGQPLTNYQFGDVWTVGGSKYVCICPNPPTGPVVPLDPNWSDPNWAWEPWTNAPTKTSVNTGTFQQLYAAYWAVMADQYVPGSASTSGQWFPPYFGANPNNPTSLTNPTNSKYGRMFRNPIRFNSTTPPVLNSAAAPVLSSQQVMMLRASLAAVNTMALRHADKALINSYGTNDVISRTVYLPPMLKGDSGFQAQVYGVERQPYITQIFAVTDASPANAWMAVELYNPYPNAINLTNWALATLTRTTPGNMTLTSLGNLQTAAGGLSSIQPLQRVILVSSPTPPTNYTNFPSTGAGVAIYTCSGLSSAFGTELILMRPRRADGKLSPASTLPTTSNNTYQAETSPTELVPIDSYDFTNMKQPPANGGSTQEWWYIRPNGVTTVPPSSQVNKEWHFVYPGPWMLSTSAVAPAPGTPQPPTWTGTYYVSPANPSEKLSSFGTPQPSPESSVASTNYRDTVIQMNNVDFGGPNQPSSASPINSQLPLGAFPRNGDILQVTFIGSYKLTGVWAPTKICEINPVTADSAMATACESSTDTQQPISTASTSLAQVIVENVGRFCPIDPDDANGTNGNGVNDFASPPLATPPAPQPTSSPLWRYHWATRLFDFLTVQAPQDDYLPDVDPWMNDRASAASPPHAYRYPPADDSPAYIPAPVANITAGAMNAGLTPPVQTPTGASEDTVPINGLINVNTAPWRVLATIPWFPATTTAGKAGNYRTYNANVAIGLALYRDGNPLTMTPPHGPFRNLFELGEAKISTMGNKKLRDILFTQPPPGDPMPSAAFHYFTLPQGNLTLIDGSTPQNNVPGDFLALFNTITRISNLVTTRSDSYTAYVLIQGWRNAETANPQLVVQRRAAVIIDRSSVTPNNRSPNATNVPQ